MASSMARQYSDTPDKSLSSASTRMVKADIRDKAPQSDLSGLIRDTARKVYGKQASAAAEIGKAESNFSRDLDAGRINTSDLARLGPQFLAELGKELVDQYAPLATPHARMRQQIKVARAALDELEQGMEQIA